MELFICLMVVLFEVANQRVPLTQERMLRHQVPNDVVPTSSLVGFAGAIATGITMWVIILLIALG